MKLDIRGRNIEVTDALKDYTTKRLSKLDKYLDETRTAQVAMSLEGEKHKEKHKVEVTIPLNGLMLRAEVGAEDMYAAIDLVVEKLDKQIDKHKTKLYRRHRGRSAAGGGWGGQTVGCGFREGVWRSVPDRKDQALCDEADGHRGSYNADGSAGPYFFHVLQCQHRLHKRGL